MEQRIFGYDVVRAIAILLVMLGHVLGYLYSGTYSFFLSFFSGFFGVELFFVLSGVLIGKLLIEVFKTENYKKNLQKFLIRRWLRTLPLYFVMLFVYALGNHFLDPIPNDDVALWKYFFFIQNFFKVQPTFFGVSWSLSVEEWFYVLFPLTLLLVRFFFRSISVRRLFVFGVAFYIGFFLLMRFLGNPHYDFNFYEGVRKIAFFRLDAVAYGILAAFGFYFYGTFFQDKKYIILLLAILILGINQYIIFADHYSHLYYFNTVYYSVLGLGIAGLFPFFKSLKTDQLLVQKSITFISKISYSLYLIHWLVYKFLEIHFFTIIPNVVKFFAFFILSFLAASITYYLIEKPVLKWRNRFS